MNFKLFNWAKIYNTSFRSTFQRSSSNFKRSQFIAKHDQLADIKAEYFHNREALNNMEWMKVKELLMTNYKHINRHNVDAVIVGVCNDSQLLHLAKSYIKHLKDNGIEPNQATLGKLLRIYNSVYHAKGGMDDSLSPEEQNEILEIYANIRTKHELLDSVSCENLICGLVATKKWKDGLELMEMMKLTASPTLTAFNEMAIKSFRMQDMTLGWNLLHQMLEQRKQPKCDVFLAYLDAIARDVKRLSTELEKLFAFLMDHDVVITEKTAKAINDVATKHPKLLNVTLTRLKRYGKCASCGLHMQNVSLSDEDFQNLQHSFLDKVLIRNDVFQKSTPEEIERFCEYVERTGPYDCVIDGLNVAYSMGSKKPPQAIANLVSHCFISQKLGKLRMFKC